MILLNYPEAFAFAVLSAMAFAVIFQAPKNALPVCGVVGAVGWLVYIHLSQTLGVDSFYANLAASLAVSLLSEINARLWHHPVTVVVIPGLFPIVPGLAMYKGMTQIIEKNYDLGMSLLLQAGMDASAIALGVMVVGSLFRAVKLRHERAGLKRLAKEREEQS